MECYYYGFMATLKLNFINSESNLSELASMMKLLYERINTADGGVTQHSTVLYITESVGERKLLYSPVSSPGQAQHGSLCLCLCDSLLHPCHNQLGMVFRTSLPYQHLTLSLSPERLLKSDTDREDYLWKRKRFLGWHLSRSLHFLGLNKKYITDLQKSHLKFNVQQDDEVDIHIRFLISDTDTHTRNVYQCC